MLRLDSAAAVRRLHEDVIARAARKPARVSVGLSQLSRDENDRLSRKLDRLHNACGCQAAAACGLGGLLATLIWTIARTAPLAWSDVGWCALAFCLGTAIGKIAGSVVARRRLLSELAELRRRLELSRRQVYLGPDPMAGQARRFSAPR